MLLAPLAGARAQDADGLPEEIAPLPISPGPIPDPPRQGARWRAPRGTPPALGTIAERLIALGLPDPRGCEYRAIAIYVGRDAWDGHGGIVRTRGWVLPGRRWAIAHNGMIYAVAAVGARVDLARAPPCEERGMSGDLERSTVACGFGLFDSVQLLRLGQLEAAVARTTEAMLRDPSATVTEIALVWAWLARARGIGAHIRGDDPSALHALRIAVRARDVARDGGVPEHGEPVAFGGTAPLAIADTLLADHERRASAPPPPVANVATLPLPALIAALDQVGAVQMGQPGGFAFTSDPIVRAIVSAGPAAVAPLIDAVERDERLTRSIYAWRDFVPSREVVTVRTVARVIVMNLLGVDELWDTRHPAPALVDDAAVAARLRELAAEHGSAAERIFAVLADPGAPIHAWGDAATRMVRPWGERFWDAGWGPGELTWDGRVGAALRPRTDEVADLLADRLADAVSQEGAALPRSCMLARVLIQWQPRREPLRPLFDRCRAPSAHCTCLPQLANALHELGDRDALHEYGGRVRALPPRGLYDLLEPVFRHPAHPASRSLADWYVARSPWAGEVAGFLQLRALRVEPFARAIFAALSDPSRRDAIAAPLAQMLEIPFDRTWPEERRADAIDAVVRAARAWSRR